MPAGRRKRERVPQGRQKPRRHGETSFVRTGLGLLGDADPSDGSQGYSQLHSISAGSAGRVKRCQHHEAPKILQTRPVQVQCDHRRASRRSLPLHVDSVFSPGEMLAPSLPTRMEERFSLSCGGIKGLGF